jgi:PAS domain S-box-containing protein
VTNLDRAQGDPVFDAQPVPTLLLDRNLTIRAVNRAYSVAVGRSAEELLGLAMFEAFPDNPDDPDADGVANLSRSLETVAHQRRPHNMLVQRYDIPVVRRGGWLPRVWSPLNSPVVADDEVVGMVHQVRDITPVGSDVREVLLKYRDHVLETAGADKDAQQLAEVTDAVATTVLDNEALATEVFHLRRALSSRAVIEQAKGIVMAERRCTPDEAFEILRKLSGDANVRLADVALALVYRAQGRPENVTPEPRE